MTGKNHRRSLIFVFLILAFVLFCAFVLSGFWIRTGHYRIHRLTQGFSITKNGELLSADVPEEALRTPARKGDVYVMEGVLPNDPVPSAALLVYARSSVLDCYVNDQLIYSYGINYLARDRFVPKGYHLIPLPEDYASASLRLRYTVCESDVYFMLTSPEEGSIHDLITTWVSEDRLVIFLGVFLVLFGFLMSMLSLMMHIYEDRSLQMFIGGLVAMNLGLFALCYYNAFFFVTRNLWLSTVIETLSQFLLPVCITAFMRLSTTDRRIRLSFNVCLTVSAAATALALVLQFTGFFPLTRSLFYYQILSVVNGIVVVFFGLQILKRRLLQYRRLRSSTASVSGGLELSSGMILLIGIFVVLFAILGETLLAPVARFLVHTTPGVETRVLSLIGMSVYAVFIMMSYFYHGIGVTYERSQSWRLEHLAYTDALTSLPNRAYCKRVLDTLAEAGKEYCVISIDVNFLKQVNDMQGHAAGDELLKNFADVLRTSFRSTDVVGRLSGDEFIAILRGATLAESVEKAAHMANTLPFSISYGCAHSTEVVTANAWDVYKRADERMFEMKQEIHGTHA
ncbi:MAG: GGDEF domain-containing protein [Lachnospiraceae bacterium]|nr:GGDEF domain-containing protein [Lachnospiraceae bacterium]